MTALAKQSLSVLDSPGARAEDSRLVVVPPPSSLSETPVVRFEQLFDEYHDFVWRVLRRLGLDTSEADDAAQEVFMVVLGRLELITPGRERSFLYGTARRVSCNVLRRRANAARRNTPFDDTQDTQSVAPDKAAELSQARAELDEILQALPAKVARVLVLIEIEQLAVPEVAQLEEIPEGTVASRLRKGRLLVQEHLERRRARERHRAYSALNDRPLSRGRP